MALSIDATLKEILAPTVECVLHESSAFESILEEGAIKASHRHLLSLGQKRLGIANEETVAA
jgi:hypothetical protein